MTDNERALIDQSYADLQKRIAKGRAASNCSDSPWPLRDIVRKLIGEVSGSSGCSCHELRDAFVLGCERYAKGLGDDLPSMSDRDKSTIARWAEEQFPDESGKDNQRDE